jgi:transcription initiation factor TFIIIB Brf1 subunit/transcription initiation factor TFIIB
MDLWPTLHKPIEKTQLPELDLETEQICPVCTDSTEVETIGHEVLCLRCGTVLDVPLELGAEYRWFSSDSGADPSRCGFPVNHLMPESSLGTMILAGNSRLMQRIKRYHMWSLMPYRERTLWSIFEGLQVRASNAGIGTAVIEEAKELFAQLTVSASCRGQNQRDAMLAACLWEALKRHDSPRMPKDIADIFSLPLKSVTKGIKHFQGLLVIQTGSADKGTYANQSVNEPVIDTIQERATQRRAVWQKTVARTTTYEDFIKPFLTNLSIPTHHLEPMVHAVCERIEDLGIVPENTPPSLTASVIAFCCGHLGITIDTGDIAKVCGISPVTIQKCLKRLQPWKEKLLTQ